MKRKAYSGFTADTTQNLLLDAGAIFVNFDVEEDTFETAKGKLLGATSGGNSFEAIPEYRSIQVDGVPGKAKGLSVIVAWEVSLTTNMIEFKEETYKRALSAVEVEDVELAAGSYKEITARNYVLDSDYVDNITFVGTISGSSEPVYVQVYNALNLEGLTIENVDGDDIVAELKFEGHYDPDNLDKAPFAIYYPNREKVVTPEG